MATALNIAALARRTGVQPDTLRKWEQRYGVIRPERTAGGQRRYGERDVARVEWLKARLDEGYRIGEAAALLGSADLDGAARTSQELAEALYGAIVHSDAANVELLVEQALAVHELDEALSEVIAPVLRRVGDGWETGELTVAQEHVVSGVVRAQLDRLLADRRGAVRGVAVLACAPGERHELGLLMLAAMLRADGWQVAYLGPDTPAADAGRLADELGAGLLCVSATLPESAERLGEGLGETALPERTRLVVGGAAFESRSARALGATYGGDDLRATVAALRR